MINLSKYQPGGPLLPFLPIGFSASVPFSPGVPARPSSLETKEFEN
jgi:hypothetical protein